MTGDVHVTGVSLVSGTSIDALWDRLTTPRPCCSPVLCGATDPALTVSADFQCPTDDGGERLARVRNRPFELLCAAVGGAASDAGLRDVPVDPCRVGMVLAVGCLDEHTKDLRDVVGDEMGLPPSRSPRRLAEDSAGLDALRRLRLLPNTGTALASIARNAAGPTLTLVGGPIAGMQAILEGCALLDSGRVDVVYCGGVDGPIWPLERVLAHYGFSETLSAAPAVLGRPFDMRSHGPLFAEGAAVVVLESSASAVTRGRLPYARVCAGAVSAQYGRAAYRRVVQRTLARAHKSPDVIVAHGDGSPCSDAMEAVMLHELFAGTRSVVAAPKEALGHALSAAGPMSVVVACLSLRSHRLPLMAPPERPHVRLRFAVEPLLDARLTSELVMTLDRCGGTASVLLGAC